MIIVTVLPAKETGSAARAAPPKSASNARARRQFRAAVPALLLVGRARISIPPDFSAGANPALF
jgi:hypothetical protein